MLHLKTTVKYYQSINCCNFLKHGLVKEVFMFKIDFMVSLCNYEKTRLSLKALYDVLGFKKVTQGCLPVLKKISFISKLFSDHDEGYQAKIKSQENNKSCKSWNF